MLSKSFIAITVASVISVVKADFVPTGYDYIQGYIANGYDAGSTWISGGNIAYDGPNSTPGTPATCFAKCVALNCGAVVMYFPSGFDINDGSGNDITTYCNYYNAPIPSSVFTSQTPVNQPYTGGLWQATFNIRTVNYWTPSFPDLPASAGGCNGDGCLVSCAPQSSPNGNIGGAQCIPCPSMTFAGWNNQVSTCAPCNSVTQCKPAGYADSCKAGFGLVSRLCIACPAGTSSVDGNIGDCTVPPVPPPAPLPPMTCAPNNFVSGPRKCRTCLWAGVDSCGPKLWRANSCKAGHFLKAWTCHKCHPNHYSGVPGAVGSCTRCQSGYTSGHGATACLIKVKRDIIGTIGCPDTTAETTVHQVAACTPCNEGVATCSAVPDSRLTSASSCNKTHYLLTDGGVGVCLPHK